MNMDMDKEKRHVFPEHSVNWAELEAIGVFRDDLEYAGQLDCLLDGGQTGAVPLRLMLSGIDLEMDATLQLTRQDDTVTVAIRGVGPGESR